MPLLNIINACLPHTKMRALKYGLRSIVVVLIFSIGSFQAYSMQQDTVENEQENARKKEQQEIERIIVEGKNYDKAMRAFREGNFELAELEFKKNAKCALRMERNKQAFVSGLQNSSVDTAIQNTASVQSNSSGQGGSSGNVTPPSGNIGGKSTNQVEDNVDKARTCSNRGYQLYMTGLSQIQLGRTEEAEKNFKTASFLNNNIYDAHFRLALLGLLREEEDIAEERLTNIQDILKKCGDCEAQAEILARVDFLEKALSGEIKLK